MTMTTTLQWPVVSQHELDFDFLAFGMGHAGDFGLGLALARPERKTIVLKGDGGLLMCLGSLVTMGRYAPGNLLVLLMENRVYEMVGAQALPSRVDFTALAQAAGIEGGGATGKGKVERIADDRGLVRMHCPGCSPRKAPTLLCFPYRIRNPCLPSGTRIMRGGSGS